MQRVNCNVSFDFKTSSGVVVSWQVLWDKESRTIVNNESAEIIRMFTTVREA